MFKPNRFTVMFAGICSLVLGMGIARYSFTPMIPEMIAQTPMDTGLAGWLAGWNYMGYLVGLFIVWLVTDLRTKDFMYRYALIVAILSTLMMATHDHSLVWYASRFIAGVSTAVVFMLGTGLVMNWLHHNHHEGELGLHFTGIGFGIITCALVVDLTGLGEIFSLNWRMQWVALAGVGALFFVPAFFMLPLPAEKEVEMAREGEMLVKVEPPDNTWLWFLQIAYFCAGFSNTLNVTFTSEMAELQPLAGLGARIWEVVGISVVIAPIFWDRMARTIGPVDALRAAFVLNILGNLILASQQNLYTTLVAAVLFGVTFIGIVSLTLSTVGRLYGTRGTQVMAQLTLGYCVAQILSPILFGSLVSVTGSFAVPLFAVSGLMLIGLLALVGLRIARSRSSTPATG
ncbi:MAG: YbfB/YjiJ family MFS transporter [Pseudomonadota bacterium]